MLAAGSIFSKYSVRFDHHFSITDIIDTLFTNRIFRSLQYKSLSLYLKSILSFTTLPDFDCFSWLVKLCRSEIMV